MALPLPGITKEENTVIKELTRDVIRREDDEYLQKYINQNIFKLSEKEVEYINSFVVNRNNRHYIERRLDEDREYGE